ncbi:MAG: valine--tRNA ligase [Gammaproteobacteria bacterium]|nr:valine--tRNA ligase [Gammaproteobacteria bacterium]
MQKTYEPQTIETHWANFWEQQHYFEPNGEGQPYCIMLPPPNVTGTLHMGHGFQHTLMDVLMRQKRMQGQRSLWQAGTDHAGIATQMVIERQLETEGLTRHDLGREEFIKKVWLWRDKSGGIITQQIRRMGNSLAWSRERFSLDEQVSRATNEAFIRLYNDGLIYRGKRLVNWDPKLNTAISDLEVNNQLESGQLWHIRYPLSDGKSHLVVATTRPETMLGDTAVAVHPEDERYQNLIGKKIKLPLTMREIPIIADAQVDREFGTGCVKITPAHDFNDHAMGQRHKLPIINIFDSKAHTNENVPEKYRNLERFKARKQIVNDLKALDLIDKIEPHQSNVPRGDRSGAVIEPLLTDQWFVKTEGLAKRAIEVVKNGKLKIIPENWTKTYLQWLNNIQDWCISRQLWWGQRIPVWYDDAGKYYVGHNEQEVRKQHHLANDITLQQDDDVLDTWFTASLWPFSSLGWPEQTPELKTFYPSSVLITGFDIIFFWVARMVMMGLYLMDDVPFREVYITGLIRDSHGHKMSKTKGNILDPIDLIDGIDLTTLTEKRTRGLMQPKMAEKIKAQTQKEFPDGISAHGTDALRFTFCALANTGRDINFDMQRIAGYRNFCNKLWNAARFVLANSEDFKPGAKVEYSISDDWIRSVLQQTIERVNTELDRYRFDLAAQALYEFIWNEYCDWYLELTKCILSDTTASSAKKNAVHATLLEVLETILRLAHPLMPYITEEIWQQISKKLALKGNSIMLQAYPEVNPKQINKTALEAINWLKNIVSGIRNIRGEMGISPAVKVTAIFNKGSKADKTYCQQSEEIIKTLAKLNDITWSDKIPEVNASTVIGTLDIHIPLAGVVDKTQELKRLEKEIAKLEKEQLKSQQKLNNKNYVDKAPVAVVDLERQRLTDTETTLQKLQAHYARIKSL